MDMQNYKLWILKLITAFTLALLHACGGGMQNDRSADGGQLIPPEQPTNPDDSRPSIHNTGVPTGTILRQWTGSASITLSDTVFEGVFFPILPPNTYYVISGNNVTLKHCALSGGLIISGTNIRIERCTIKGGVSISGAQIVVLDKNNIQGSTDDLLHITSDTGRVQNITLSGNYLHSPQPACGAHADGLQVRGVDTLMILNNRIDMGAWTQVCGQDALNAAIFLEVANGGNQDISIVDNILNGGGFTLRLNTATNIRVLRNRFGRDEQYGVILNSSADGSVIEFSSNVRHDNGEAILLPSNPIP
jgi:Right handed beta helix region